MLYNECLKNVYTNKNKIDSKNEENKNEKKRIK